MLFLLLLFRFNLVFNESLFFVSSFFQLRPSFDNYVRTLLRVVQNYIPNKDTKRLLPDQILITCR